MTLLMITTLRTFVSYSDNNVVGDKESPEFHEPDPSLPERVKILSLLARRPRIQERCLTRFPATEQQTETNHSVAEERTEKIPCRAMRTEMNLPIERSGLKSP
jgi:hypothetical protein